LAPIEEEKIEPIVLPIATDRTSRRLIDEIIKSSVNDTQQVRKTNGGEPAYDGLGLDLEPPCHPSSTNVQDTLIKQTSFSRISLRLDTRPMPTEETEEANDKESEPVALKKKSNFEIRMQYLSKLTYHQVWLAPSKQKKSHQNLIVLDWDDTMLPTTFFLTQDRGESTDLEQMAKTHMRMLVSVQNLLLSLLEKMIKFAKVLMRKNSFVRSSMVD